ncbi:hypothetical protein PAPYR_12383 [Paratrimastix pyriformis]|uniref:Uncharacterized protein n=1 Tax=Paratrimastix pyriformis TaxID=342808 RepID=A0ABQ8U489_9EUKA|nr:hypothetical protein PAPYR_12383 [Paratrimastix pyriformis]
MCIAETSICRAEAMLADTRPSLKCSEDDLWTTRNQRHWASFANPTSPGGAPKPSTLDILGVYGGGSGQPGGSRVRFFVRLTRRGGAGGLVGSGTLSGKPLPGSRDLIPTCAMRRLRFAGRKQSSFRREIPCILVRFRAELRTRHSGGFVRLIAFDRFRNAGSFIADHSIPDVFSHYLVIFFYQKTTRVVSDSLRNTFSAYQCFRFYLNKIHLMLSSIHETTLRNTIDI